MVQKPFHDLVFVYLCKLITCVSAPLSSAGSSPTGHLFPRTFQVHSCNRAFTLFALPGKCFPQIFPFLISHYSGFSSRYFFTKAVPTALLKVASLCGPIIFSRHLSQAEDQAFYIFAHQNVHCTRPGTSVFFIAMSLASSITMSR